MDYGSKANSITYKSDIIKEMSEELGIPVKELEEITDMNLTYIKESVIDSDVVLVNLPNLCKLRFNMRLGLSSLEWLKIKKKLSKIDVRKKEGLEKKVSLLIEKRKEDKFLMSFKTPLFERLWRKVNRIFLGKIRRKMWRVIAQVEGYTNDIIQKIK